MDDLRAQEKLIEEEKYRKIENERMKALVQKKSEDRMKALEKAKVQAQGQLPFQQNFPQFRGGGPAANELLSDSDASIWDSDCPEEQLQMKKAIAQPNVSKQISQKMKIGKREFLKVASGVIDEKENENSDADSPRSEKNEEAQIEDLIKKVSEQI